MILHNKNHNFVCIYYKNLNNFEILTYIKKKQNLGRVKMPDNGCVYFHLFSSIFIFKRHIQIEVENNLNVEKVETTEFMMIS